MNARPKKSFGQHFLHDRRYIDRIVSAVSPRTEDFMVEIGPGEGALTLPLLHVPPGAFRPPPKVDSAVVRLVPLPAQELPDFAMIEKIVRAAFGQRRKTLSNALSEYAVAADIDAAGLDPRARAEQLAPQAYVALARVLASRV